LPEQVKPVMTEGNSSKDLRGTVALFRRGAPKQNCGAAVEDVGWLSEGLKNRGEAKDRAGGRGPARAVFPSDDGRKKAGERFNIG